MSSEPSRAGELANQIIAHELAGRETAAEVAQGIESAFHQLHRMVAALVGHVGFDAVMSRAMHLTSRSCSSFAAIDIRYESTLVMHGLVTVIEREGAAPAAGCAAMLLKNVIDLLSSFVGEALTFRIVRRGWMFPEGEAGLDPEKPRS